MTSEPTALSHDSRFTATLFLGVSAFCAEGALSIAGLISMSNGSDPEALIVVWFGAPLVVAAVLAYVVGSTRAQDSGPRQKNSRLLGFLLGIGAIPVWIMIAEVVARSQNLG